MTGRSKAVGIRLPSARLMAMATFKVRRLLHPIRAARAASTESRKLSSDQFARHRLSLCLYNVILESSQYLKYNHSRDCAYRVNQQIEQAVNHHQLRAHVSLQSQSLNTFD